MLADLLLDFLDRSNRQLYGLFHNTPRENHISLLVEALNVAVFLCDSICVSPPGPIAECDLARAALQRRSAYLVDGLIKWPLRESTWDEFFGKKEREYSPFRSDYRDLFNPEIQRFFQAYPHAILSRATEVGKQISSAWLHGPDSPGIWRDRLSFLAPKDIEIVRSIPTQIKNEGIAAAWPAVLERLPPGIADNPKVFRIVLQHYYFRTYIDEYGLRVMTGVPFASVNLGLGENDLRYDFTALSECLQVCRVWTLVRWMSAESMIALRYRNGYFKFRHSFDKFAGERSTAREVAREVAQAVARIPKQIKETVVLDHEIDEAPGVQGFVLQGDGLAALDYRLECISESLDRGDTHIQLISGDWYKMTLKSVGIFVALQMERELLVKRWKLDHAFAGTHVWKGAFGNLNLVLFGPDYMGRVRASVETMAMLSENKPDLLIVTGIAGGFSDTKVELGDVLIPDIVADLATRKVYEEESGPEFRPQPFNLDESVRDFVRTRLHRPTWETKVIEEADWPEGRRPTIHYNCPIASLDEVVSSDDWQHKLCEAWPKLVGVEMESGGVCAAAQFHKVRVAVVRGVSDLADPRKSDNEWRRRAMLTVASVLEEFFKTC